MKLEIAAELCRRFEGFRSKPYLCPAGVPTIGYGSTFYADGRRVTMQDAAISKDEANALLIHELEHKYAPAVIRLCPGLLADAEADDWRTFNAIVDFVYNLGAGRLQTSTLRKRINEKDWQGVCDELMKWTRGGGRVLPGLVTRRKAECELIKNRI